MGLRYTQSKKWGEGTATLRRPKLHLWAATAIYVDVFHPELRQAVFDLAELNSTATTTTTTTTIIIIIITVSFAYSTSFHGHCRLR